MRRTPFLLLTAACALLGACAHDAGLTIASRREHAQDIAAAARLTPFSLNAPPFALAGWGKIDAPGQPIRLYIEGDGLAWLSKREPSRNPTPKDPLGLRLAAADSAPNVVYLARPCQYSVGDCDSSYWKGKRFAPEVIAAYDDALNQIAQKFEAPGFNLVGYSGGANIAALLAERRQDVWSLRTVAGNLDNDALTALHGVSAMPGSLNAAREAAKIANLSQIHFVGGADETVPASIAQGFKAAANGAACVNIEVLPGVTHEEGWVEAWPDLLTRPFSCSSP